MSRRSVRLRPVRRESVDVRRLAEALAALAAEQRRESAGANDTKSEKKNEEAA